MGLFSRKPKETGTPSPAPAGLPDRVVEPKPVNAPGGEAGARAVAHQIWLSHFAAPGDELGQRFLAREESEPIAAAARGSAHASAIDRDPTGGTT